VNLEATLVSANKHYVAVAVYANLVVRLRSVNIHP
jgi:hypothetical protein